MDNTDHQITLVGLGPGDPALLTIEARETIALAPEVWLRTGRHPTTEHLPVGPSYRTFDDVYERGGSFEEVYESIVSRVLELGGGPGGVVYAVPGHPLFGESTARELLRRAGRAHMRVRVVPGISFLDVAAPALGLDPLEQGLLLVDALALGEGSRVLTPQRPLLIAQVYDRRAASQAKLALLEVYPPGHQVRIVRESGDGEAGVIERTVADLDREDLFDHLTTLYVPPIQATDDLRTFEGLRAIVAWLRAPEGGCPWDLEQTHETLKRFLLEEAYEALAALDEGDPQRLADELGDLLMQIVLHAQVAEDAGTFAIEDVIGAIAAKLVRRHPHVFGNAQVSGAQEVLANWEVLKREERGEQHPLDAVPLALPALAQAQSLLGRAAAAGLAPAARGDVDALQRAVADLADGGEADGQKLLGALLFDIVTLALERGLDAEEALRLAIRDFRERARHDESARV